MKLVVVDSNNRYEVGDEINPYGEDCSQSFNFDKMNDITVDKAKQIIFWRVDNRKEYWALCCQRFFYIVDEETGKILFSANGYTTLDREDESCPFYDELEEFFQTLDKSERPCILDDNEDFVV